MTHARGIAIYSRVVVDTVLGLFGMAVFVVATIALAAGVTWIVVKITPSGPKKKPPEPTPEA